MNINTKYIKIPDSEYFDNPALSRSSILSLLRSPYKYFNNIKKSRTESMKFGEYVHKLVLESDLNNMVYHECIGQNKFNNKKIIIEPEFNKRTNEGKLMAAEFKSENKDAFIIEPKYKHALNCALEIKKSKVMNLFKDTHKEVTYFNNIFNYHFKIKIDAVNLKSGICIDLKTATSSEERHFKHSIIDNGYHIQAYLYTKILNIPIENFYFIVVENTPPYIIGVYNLDGDYAYLAEREVLKALKILENKELYNDICLTYDVDMDKPIKIKTLKCPTYLL